MILEDCSGKHYTLPEVTLSDEVSGGNEESGGEGYAQIWKGDVYIYDWTNWQYLTSDQLSLDGFQIREGLMMRLTFDNPDGASVCVCDANWGTPDVDGAGNNTVWVSAGVGELEFAISQGMAETLLGGGGIIIGGGESDNNITLAAGEDFLELEISEGMAATMNGGSDTALIIGGDITITKIQIKTD